MGPGFVFSQNSLVLGSMNMVMDCHKHRGVFFCSRAQELSKEFSAELLAKPCFGLITSNNLTLRVTKTHSYRREFYISRRLDGPQKKKKKKKHTHTHTQMKMLQ